MSVDSLIRSQHFRNWQAAPSPMVNCPWLNADSVRPLFDAQRFPAILNKHKWLFFATVVCLFCSCSPSAVSGLIIPVVVDAVNGIIKAGAFPHIVAECLERIKPAIAYRYSTFPVAVKASCKWAKASVFHRLPRFVSHPVVATVRNAPFPRNIKGEASATSASVANRLISQIGACSKAFSSARASTSPNDEVSCVSPRERNDGQPAECLPCEVKNSVVEFRTLKTFAMINLSHDHFLALKGRLWLEPKRRYSAARLDSLYTSRCEVCNVAC